MICVIYVIYTYILVYYEIYIIYKRSQVVAKWSYNATYLLAIALVVDHCFGCQEIAGD